MIKELRVHRGKVIVREGTQNPSIFLIRKGEFVLSKSIKKPIEKNQDPRLAYMKSEKELISKRN